MARSIFIFQGLLEEPKIENPKNPFSRDQLIELFEERLDGMIRYRVLGKYFYTHNNYGLEANLPFKSMPAIRFDLRKTGIEVLEDYIRQLADELGPITVFNPEKDHIQIKDPEHLTDDLEDFLWPEGYNPSIEI